VKETNISDWRRKTFGDLTSAFRFDEAKADPPLLPDTSGPLAQARYDSIYLPKPAAPSSGQTLPAQEKGVRKRIG